MIFVYIDQRMTPSQKDFLSDQREYKKNRLEHGGEKLSRLRLRKLKRPFDRKHLIHLTLKSKKAQGQMSFLRSKNRARIEAIIQRHASKNGAKIERFANVGNHLHLAMRFPSRVAFKRFLRSVTGLIARAVTGAEKGKAFGKFWDCLAHSRVVVGRRAVSYLLKYIEANRVEAKLGGGARLAYAAGLPILISLGNETS